MECLKHVNARKRSFIERLPTTKGAKSTKKRRIYQPQSIALEKGTMISIVHFSSAMDRMIS
jgi:hypothetical protein